MRTTMSGIKQVIHEQVIHDLDQVINYLADARWCIRKKLMYRDTVLFLVEAAIGKLRQTIKYCEALEEEENGEESF